MEHVSPLTREEETAYIQRLRQGDRQAFETLVLSHQGLVWSMAIRFQNSGWAGDLTREDLIQIGNLGLTAAIKRFDLSRGLRLDTLAGHYIRGYILRYAPTTGSQYSISVRDLKKLAKISKARAILARNLRRKPTPEEIEAATGIPAKFATEMLPMIDLPPLELDNPSIARAGEPEGDDWTEHIPDFSIPIPADVEARAFLAAIHKAVQNLPEPEREIITRRFLVNPPEYREVVASTMQITYSEVLNAERHGIKKLRRELAAWRG